MSGRARVTRASLPRRVTRISRPRPMSVLPQRVWSAEEWRRIQLGACARDFDERWDLFTEGRVVFVHRSWTGYGIFEASFVPAEGGGWRIGAARVEADPQRFRGTDDGDNRRLLEAVIDAVACDDGAEDEEDAALDAGDADAGRTGAGSIATERTADAGDAAARNAGAGDGVRVWRTGPGRPDIVLIGGDITQQEVDAVVNAAGSSLQGGGGVAGAIHRRGGPAILRECLALRVSRYARGLPTGEAVATTAGALPARWVIHTVGPVYSATLDRADLLAACYRNSLRIADELGAETVAFPAISAGAYGWPLAGAARIAVATVAAARTSVREARFVLFGPDAYAAFARARGEVAAAR